MWAKVGINLLDAPSFERPVRARSLHGSVAPGRVRPRVGDLIRLAEGASEVLAPMGLGTVHVGEALLAREVAP
ncbi:hypothetical protein GCM10012319_22300 [Comamonas sp. KCTC 72670]|nr:hypothetical protein GCM10012319_22300 [Comamonas sp. KCTC 72670]